jgi:hypothetical protein
VKTGRGCVCASAGSAVVTMMTGRATGRVRSVVGSG